MPRGPGCRLPSPESRDATVACASVGAGASAGAIGIPFADVDGGVAFTHHGDPASPPQSSCAKVQGDRAAKSEKMLGAN